MGTKGVSTPVFDATSGAKKERSSLISSALVAFRQIICRDDEPHLAEASADIPMQMPISKTR
ncbi:MAG: hypothetical protein ACKN9S_05995 [Pirellula sp.]